MENKVSRKSISELSSDARILINVLETKLVKEKADIVSYAELTAAILKDVQKQGRSLLQTARNYIEKEHNVLLDCVFNEGVKITKDYVGTLDNATDRIRKLSKKAIKRTIRASVNDNLTNEQLVQVNARSSLLGAIVQFSNKKKVAALECAIKENQCKELPVAKTLDMFK